MSYCNLLIMRYFKFILRLIIPTTISAILFFAVSFLTWLREITSPRYTMPTAQNQLEVGFPFPFYHQFCMDDCSLRCGWNLEHLLMDCLIFWSLTIMIYLWNMKKR